MAISPSHKIYVQDEYTNIMSSRDGVHIHGKMISIQSANYKNTASDVNGDERCVNISQEKTGQ